MLMLAESRGGLTLDEMSEALGVSRRTAERLRDTVARVSGPSLVFVEVDGVRRWRLPLSRLGSMTQPTAAELAELKLASIERRQLGMTASADKLDALLLKLEAALSRSSFARLDPDIAGLLESTGSLWRPGPQPAVQDRLLERLHEAILSSRWIELEYSPRSGHDAGVREVAPLGVLFGSRGYLVAQKRDGELRTYALGNIVNLEVTSQPFNRDPSFDLATFASRSFGVYWDGQRYDVCWQFDQQVASDVLTYRFHPDQRVDLQPDGSVLVRFKASGLLEMAWHLFHWGDHVRILSPPELQRTYAASLNAARKYLEHIQ